MKTQFLCLVAQVSRRAWWVKGVDRLLRTIHSPDRTKGTGVSLIVPYNQDLLFHIDTANFLEWNIFFKGYYEPYIVQVYKRVLRPGMVAMDIGANNGCHTVIMQTLVGSSGKVIAVEPNPDAVQRLKRNLLLNRVKNVAVFELGLCLPGIHQGILIASKTNNPTGTLLIRKDDSQPDNWHTELTVEVCSLDELVTKTGINRLDLIKIDTDGCERDILLGGKDSLTRYRPHIIFEYNQECYFAHGADWNVVYNYLLTLGYTLYEIISNRYMLSLMPLSQTSSPGTDSNILAAPSSLESKSE